MDEEFKKQLVANGADVETTINRFMGNEGLYVKFLMKFQDDKNYESIQEHIAAGQYGDAFNDAHTLKGVSANLGLNPIYEGASRLVELLRGKQPEEIDVEEVNRAKDELGEKCELFRKLLEEHK